MRIVSSDPYHSGTILLAGERKQLLVWHNMRGWTDAPGSTWTAPAPPWSRSGELWAWNGLRGRYPVSDGKVRINGLPGNETYMLLLR